MDCGAKMQLEQAAAFDAETKIAEAPGDHKAELRLWLRLLTCTTLIEGEIRSRLREGFDGLDAFLAHTWAVTVTGAPKAWAMQFIEDLKKKGNLVAYVGDVVGTGSSRKSATNSTNKAITVSAYT